MGYAQTTSGNLDIPVISTGEAVQEKSEVRAADIVENVLQGIVLAQAEGGTYVVTEGTYTGNFVSGASTLTLSVSDVYSLQAFIGGVFIETTSALVWSALANNTTYYAYAQLVETDTYGDDQVSSRQSKELAILSNTSGVTPANAVLLAKIVTTGAAITVTSGALASDGVTFSDGKQYRNIAVRSDQKLLLSTSGTTYLKYNSTLNQLEIYVNGILATAFSGVP